MESTPAATLPTDDGHVSNVVVTDDDGAASTSTDSNFKKTIDQIAVAAELFMTAAKAQTIRSTMVQSDLMKNFLSDVGGQNFVALCEVQTQEDGVNVVQVEATTRLGAMMDKRITACVVLTKRLSLMMSRGATTANAAPSATSPVEPNAGVATPNNTNSTTNNSNNNSASVICSLKDLHFQTMSLASPLEELQSILMNIYEPLCSQRDAAIRGSIHELVSIIRSKDSVKVDFKIQRYIHSELLSLCTAHPQYDVKQLVDALGAKATDVSFLKDVQQVRNKCQPILELDIHLKDVAPVREEIAYWQSTLEWLEDVQQQVQSREWKFVQRILQHRVDSAAEAQLSVSIALVKEYLKVLHAIPVGDILAAKDEKDVVAIARRISEYTTRCGRYPIRRMVAILDHITVELVDKLLEFAAKRNVLAMRPTEEAHPYFRSLRDMLTELAQTYCQQFDVITRKNTTGNKSQEQHRLIRDANMRVRRLQEFTDDHFSFYDSMKRVFTTGDNKRFVDQLENLHSEFAAAVSETLWLLDEVHTAQFQQALQNYEHGMKHTEEDVAMLINSMLASAPNSQEMYRIHAQFRGVKRQAIRDVIHRFRMPLLEMISSGLKDAQDRFLDVASAQRSIRVSITTGLSPLAARIVWEKSVEQAISQLLVKRDSLSDFGWHQLLSLQTLERRWRLSDALTQYMGVSMHDVTRENGFFTRDSELHGTALALAYLELIYPSDRSEWERDLGVRVAKTFVKQDQNVVATARVILEKLLSNREVAKDLEQMKDARNARQTILKNIDDDVNRWIAQVKSRIHDLELEDGFIKNYVYRVIENPATGTKELAVSIPREFDTWLNDVQHLTAQGVVSFTDGSSSNKEVALFFVNNQRRLALANILRANLENLNGVMAKDDGTIPTLLAAEHDAVYRLIQQETKLRWTIDVNVEKHVRQLSEALSQLLISVDSISRLTSVADEQLEKLTEEHCSPQEIRAHVNELRTCVNSISLKSPNALPWVRKLVPKLEKALIFQLEGVIKQWTAQFRSLATDPRYLDETAETSQFRLKPLRVHMRVVQRQVQLETTAPEWRTYWYAELNKAFQWLGDIPTLDNLHNVNVASSVLGGAKTVTRKSTYHCLIDQLPAAVLKEPMEEIERCIEQAIVMESQWRGSQQFLNLDISLVQEHFGDNLKQWLVALQQVRAFSAKQMDGTQPSSLLGGIVIVSEEAQRELGKKLDQMNHYLNVKFLEKAEQRFDITYRAICNQRNDVEALVVNDSDQDALKFLSSVAEVFKFIREKEQELQVLVDAETYLKKQPAFKFPENWIYTTRIKDAFRTLKEIVDRKNIVVEAKRAQLCDSMKDSITQVEYRIGDLDRRVRSADLDSNKRSPPQAVEETRQFLVEANRLNDEVTKITRAQPALGLDVFNSPKLDGVLSDLQGLKLTWEHLQTIHEELAVMGARPFFETTPRNIQNELNGLEAKMTNFPDATRSYQAYKEMQLRIGKIKSFGKILQDLRSDAMAPLDRAERHWIALKTQLRQTTWVLHNLSLQDFWNSNPVANSKIYHGVLEIAQGERRLESQVQQIAAFWQEHILETTFYQNKVSLVKGWDALFERLGEDLNSLTAMKLSPFFKAQHITTVATHWDHKLNTVRQVLEVLLDVQRRWVYLDGIFTGSQEIRFQLASEASQFDKTSRDFISFMPKAKQGPMTAVQFVADDKLQSSFEKLATQLTQIQRALGDYLDTQRSRFPRFYFVGDDDLLEVIGSGKDPLQVSKHLKKMFSGMSSVQMNSSSATIIQAMQSPEGELVTLHQQVEAKDKAVYEWLSELQEASRLTLKNSVSEAVQSYGETPSAIIEWISKYPSQVAALVAQIHWAADVETALTSTSSSTSGGEGDHPVTKVETKMIALLQQLAKDVLNPQLGSALRQKVEQIITVAVYQRDTSRMLATKKVALRNDFEWLCRMRPYHDAKDGSVQCHMADAPFEYSYEYLGMQERLVQTSLTDKCFLTLTQALHTRLGGSPSGPAGTGKTETVKALGAQLGRFVLVFNCDETFDFKSMGRIFVGLCQVGAWGCFDEFNRLEERILSAVSQQIQSIQDTLRLGSHNVSLDGKKVPVHGNTGIFITMNPGYAGRSNLPDNLKQLFRSVAMISPDRENIAEVMLFAQGFKTAETLSKKVVPLFRLCKDQLSHQSHYDFGLRALKSVLISAGGLKRSAVGRGEVNLSVDDEQQLLMQSLSETIVPKLVAEDVELFYPLLGDVFPGLKPVEEPLERLKEALVKHSEAHGYNPTPTWLAKLVQLYKILHVNHGIMLVGSSATGKSSAWMTLLRALADVEDIDGHAYVMDPKAISKAELYGVLDPTTREWKDGIFTATLRRIVDNVKGDDQRKKRHWIIFDGDVDPEWVENLNSLLDDNRLFTLPNGERLTLPNNVRIMFEVQNLRYATPATVSRCGMIWFSEDTITTRHLLEYHCQELRQRPFTSPERSLLTFVERGSVADARREKRKDEGNDTREFTIEQEQLQDMQQRLLACVQEQFNPGGFVEQALQIFETKYSKFGIMKYNRCQSIRAMVTLFAQSAQIIRNHVDQGGADMSANPVALSTFAKRRLYFAILWGFGSQLTIAKRSQYGQELRAEGLPQGVDLLDVEIDMDGNWSEWKKRVVKTEINADKVGTNDVVIPTVDTVRHEEVISSWLRTGKPVVLCGPPGSGKTMSLTAVLRASSALYEAVFLNFSSATNPDTILKSLEQYCNVRNTLDGLTMAPISNKKLIVFCDEINLPSLDKYGTQRVVQLMRQLTERQGYYREKDNAWIRLVDVQFVGACNPPTDPGRVPLTHRFLRWAPVLFVDFPSFDSLQAIYETYCRAMFYKNIKMRAVSPNLAKAMVAFFKASQERFTPEIQRHYVYSPRELSRWSRAIYEGIQTLDETDQKNMSIEDVVRLAVHEGLRIFRDRLTAEDEEIWTDDAIDQAFFNSFSGLPSVSLQRPILFSTVFTKAYVSVDRESLRMHLRERLREFRDEELDVELVVFDSVIDHVVRIDRVLRQPLGHMLLVGSSGVGKTVLSRFVAWLNHLSVFQVKAHRGYTLQDFEEDLRTVMRRAGCKREKICFIFDESNIMDSNFLEYMNALLASGEVPGLFDGDAWAKLMQSIREGVATSGSSDYVDTSSEQELYRWFIKNVQLYLHVVFTMNPSSPDFQNRSATSPALFNRCTIDWFGDWSSETTFHVAKELSARVDVLFGGNAERQNTDFETAHIALASCINKVHEVILRVNQEKRQKSGATAGGTFITPRHFLDFIKHFHNLFKEKRNAVEDLQRHLNSGLSKLYETSLIVDQQQRALEEKEKILAESGRKAQEMLDRIITETDKAKRGKQEATELKAFLEVESVRISDERVKVETELAQAEPALKDAEAALNTIKPEYLREIRAYATPPPMVKKVLEAVVTLLGEKRANDWEVIKGYMRRDDFILQVKAFRPSAITDDVREKVKKGYIADDNFTYDSAQRASKAAGPLQKWVAAQVRFSDIFASVGPLRAEIDRLADQYQAKLAGLEKAQADIQENEASISRLKETYQATTEENSRIKMEINAVASRCNRAKNLMSNLLAEKSRWEEQSAGFSQQTMCVIGDCILAAAFLAYIGYFDEQYRRHHILPEWQDAVDACGIEYRRDMSMVEYLSRPEQRLEWAAHKLPQDNLCLENAIILGRFQRYPLIIDPSGQAVEFLLSHLQSKKIAKTSFVEKGFMKQLENAVRFGYPILVQDVENIDPVLNPLLNQEVRRVGGRQLVRLGSQDVDISPTFALYLSTRDHTYTFSPDICGRVTMVNFTVTLSSLQSQCLHHVMLHERPDVDEKRSDLMKLQGEYRARLRTLEQDLLTAISVSEGNILENEQLIKTLETLKTESFDIQTKFNQSEQSFEEIRAVESQYAPLARAASKLYFSMELLRELDDMYVFSLKFFFSIVDVALHALPETASRDQRIPVIARQLFVIAHHRITRAAFERDHLAIALRLAQLRSSIRDDIGGQIGRSEWDLLLASVAGTTTTTSTTATEGQSASALQGLPVQRLTPLQLQSLLDLIQIPCMSALKASVCASANIVPWTTFFECADPAEVIPSDAIDSRASPARRAFMVAVILKALRRDAFTAAGSKLLRQLFDCDSRGNSLQGSSPGYFPFYPTNGLQLQHLLPELSCSTPLLLVSTAGYDASGRVDELAAQAGKSLMTVAMGSAEGYEEAERYLAQCMKQGGWVLLKNVHFASKFLSELEKRLHSESLENKIHKQFQLFLSSERSSKIPTGLIASSVVVVLEPPPGVKASLLRTFGSLSANNIPPLPKELPRLYFSAAWLHAVVTERMQYIPLGWTKKYEFSEADFRRVVTTINAWVQRIRGERQNIPPQELPWSAIRRLVSETIYGGRVDNEFDDGLLVSFCEAILDQTLFQATKQLVPGDDRMKMESVGYTVDDINLWIQQLPEQQPPSWLGLPSSATAMVLSQRTVYTCDALSKIQSAFHDDDDGLQDPSESNVSFDVTPSRSAKFRASFSSSSASSAAAADASSSSTGRHARWAMKLQSKAAEWKSAIESLPKLPSTKSSDPILSALARECAHGDALRVKLIAELGDIVSICNGSMKPSNDYRRVMDALLKEQIPATWKKFVLPPGIGVQTFITDFESRIKHLSKLLLQDGTRNVAQPIAMGWLFFPEALLTAARQCAARASQVPLEKLYLHAELFDQATAPSSHSLCLDLSNVTMEAGRVCGSVCSPLEDDECGSTRSSSMVPLLRLSWEEQKADTASFRLKVPFYLNQSRADVLAAVEVNVDKCVPKATWVQTGLCLVAWNESIRF